MLQKSDIIDRKFNRAWRGFDPVEVRYFLEMLAEEFEKLEQRITELEPIEKQLSEMNIKSPDDIIREAEEKAQKIIEDAENLAREVLDRAKTQKEKEKEAIALLTNRRDRLINMIKKVVDQQKDIANFLGSDQVESEES
ncbi:MAG: DivIVA domain-containing protein [Fidelibacterota bacterium]